MFEWLLKWYPLLVLAFSVLSAIALLWARGEFVRRADFEQLKTTLSGVATRISVERLEKRILHLERNVPDVQALMEQKVRFENLQGQIDTLQAQLEGCTSLMKRVETQLHLLLENELRG